jgi:hypothetical protein
VAFPVPLGVQWAATYHQATRARLCVCRIGTAGPGCNPADNECCRWLMALVLDNDARGVVLNRGAGAIPGAGEGLLPSAGLERPAGRFCNPVAGERIQPFTRKLLKCVFQ